MGFRRQRKVYKLVFADEEYEGLIVRARGASVEKFLSISSLADLNADDQNALVATIREVLTTFADLIVDWNLEDEDGTPIPATAEALLAEDFDLVLTLVTAWVNAVGDVAGPLVNSSTPGEMQEVAASLRMESLSPNPQNSLVPS